MGIFRGGLLVIFSILFFLCLLVQGFFLTVYFSLDYNTVNPQLSSIASDLMQKQGVQQQILEKKPMIEEFCKNNLEFVFSDPVTNQVFVISCNESLEDSNALVQKQVSNLVEEKYYQEYDCKFFDCIQKTNEPFSLVSKHSQDYWKTKFFSSLIVFFILAGIIFLLVEHKSNFFILSSALFAISSLAFLKLDIIAEFVLKPFFSVSERIGNLSFSSFLDLFSVFLVKSPLVFVFFLSTGILLLVIGLIMNLFGIGFEISGFINKISGWFKKDSSNQTPSEIKKEKVEEKASSVETKKPAKKKTK